MENKNLLEIQKLNALFSQKEQELEGELFKLRESSEEQRQHSERQYKESIEKLSNKYNKIEQKLKLQSDISTNHFAKLVQKEKEFADKENAFFALILEIKNKKHTQAEKHLESLVLREREFNEKLEQLRTEAQAESQKIREDKTVLHNRFEAIAGKLNQITLEKHTVELQLHSELARHQELLSDLRQKLIRLRSSVSWKLTAPLRAIGSLLVSDQSDHQPVPLAIAGDACRSYIKQSSSEVDLPPIHELIAISEPIENLNPDYEETVMTSSPTVAATSINELLAYHDAEFVHCAYITLLGRSPDPEGMRYYLGYIRAGRAKIAIVNQLVSSAEAKVKNLKLDGLLRAVKIYRIQNIPFVGNVLNTLYGHSSSSLIEQKLSMIENQIYRNNKDYIKKLDWFEKNLISLRKDIKNSINTTNTIQTKNDFNTKISRGTTYIDISTLMKWNRPPVGIIRVLLEVVKYSLHDFSTQYFCFNSSKDDMKIIDQEIVIGLVERLSNLHHSANHIDSDQYFAKMRMLLDFATQTEVGADDFLPFHDGQLSPLFGSEVLIAKNMNSFFESHDIIVSIGLDWDSSNYSILHWLKKRIGFTVVGAFYDGIPVVAPHLVQSFGFSQMFFQHIYNLIHLSDKIFSISDFSENQLRTIINEHHIECIPDIKTIYLGDSNENGSKNTNNHSYKSRDHAKNYAIYVSTIETRKNHKILLEVWKQMIDLNISNIPDLVCVGMWGWGIEELRERYFSDKDLQKYVHFYDDVDDVELGYLYQGAIFSLFPSFMEGWGLGAVESMTYGIPSIISTTPALMEATQNLMPSADPENPEEWIVQISKILNDAQYLDSLRTVIKRNFERKSWTTFSREFYSFILENK